MRRNKNCVTVPPLPTNYPPLHLDVSTPAAVFRWDHSQRIAPCVDFIALRAPPPTRSTFHRLLWGELTHSATRPSKSIPMMARAMAFRGACRRCRGTAQPWRCLPHQGTPIRTPKLLYLYLNHLMPNALMFGRDDSCCPDPPSCCCTQDDHTVDQSIAVMPKTSFFAVYDGTGTSDLPDLLALCSTLYRTVPSLPHHHSPRHSAMSHPVTPSVASPASSYSPGSSTRQGHHHPGLVLI